MKTSRTGRLGGKRACLCKDGTYSTKCCDGSIWAQGIGDINAQVPADANKYIVTNCTNLKTYQVHITGVTLVLNDVYYIRFLDSNLDDCYFVSSLTSSGGNLIKSATSYTDCSDCQTQNP